MLITLLIYIVSILVEVISFVLPAWGLPDYLIDGALVAINATLFYNSLFPLFEIIKCIILIFGFEVVIILARLVMGLISILRGGGKIDV